MVTTIYVNFQTSIVSTASELTIVALEQYLSAGGYIHETLQKSNAVRHMRSVRMLLSFLPAAERFAIAPVLHSRLVRQNCADILRGSIALFLKYGGYFGIAMPRFCLHRV
jgi:hypothetical protein